MYGHGPTWLAQRDAFLNSARAELAADHGYPLEADDAEAGR